MSRHVMVTGASSGIGRATALALAERGHALLLITRRAETLERVADECRLRGARSVAIRALDVSDRTAVAELFAGSERWDAVVHAAAVAAYGRFVDVPGEVFDRVQEVNVLGSANVAREAIRHFESQAGGHLVLLGSIVGKVTTPFLSPYVVSKWAVQGLARTLQGELRDPDIQVTIVEPAGVDTALYEKAASYLGVQGKPPPPVMTPEKVAKSVLRVLDRPRREQSVGVLNPMFSLAFRLVPSVYDRVVAPLMSRIALDSRPVDDHPGNLFEPLPEPSQEGLHARTS